LAAGATGPALRPSEIPFGGNTLPEGTKVAQVLPDSGFYSAVCQVS